MRAPERATGVLRPGGGYGPCDHAAWGYASDDERAATAAAWLADGLRRGQRAMYIAEAGVDELAAELARHAPELEDAIAAGALVVASTTDVYDLGTPIDAATQLAGYDDAVERAIADGFDGIRVAADITPLVADPGRRDAHLRWEQIADRYMTTRPLAPICLYDTRRLVGIDAIVCAHPLRDADHAAFAVYGSGRHRTSIAGEVDRFAADPFTAALDAIPRTDTSVDITALSFLDAHAAWLLASELERRREGGAALAVTGTVRALVRRMWDLCGLDATLLESDAVGGDRR